MLVSLGALRVLLGVFFTLTGAAKLFQVSAPVSQQMVSDTRGRIACAWFPGNRVAFGFEDAWASLQFSNLLQVGGNGTSTSAQVCCLQSDLELEK